MEQINVRFEADMKRRVQDFMKKFEKKTNAKLGFGAAVRLLVEEALQKEGIK